MMQAALERFFERPTARHYRAARAAVFAETEHRLELRPMLQALAAWRARDAQAVMEHYDELLPDWALSARAHFLAAAASELLADEDGLELSLFMMRSCLEGILATGDGSERAPYLVSYVTDTWDIEAALGLQVRRFRLCTSSRGRTMQELRCAGRDPLWLDVTDIVAAGWKVESRQLRRLQRTLNAPAAGRRFAAALN